MTEKTIIITGFMPMSRSDVVAWVAAKLRSKSTSMGTWPFRRQVIVSPDH